jgi:hypothetical protein
MTASETPGIKPTPSKISEHRKIRFSLFSITLSHSQLFNQGITLKDKFARKDLRNVLAAVVVAQH